MTRTIGELWKTYLSDKFGFCGGGSVRRNSVGDAEAVDDGDDVVAALDGNDAAADGG